MGPCTVSRREFLKRNAAVAGALAAPLILPSGVLAAAGRPGANDRVILGVIGTGGRARQLMDQLPEGGRIVAISDCYVKRMEETLQQKQKDWKQYPDYRKMFEAETLDAVIIATPDHGRPLPCIHACPAGLDVFAEKPLTVCIAEGRAIVNAARRHQRVFQVGSQQRTMEMNRFACDLVRNGGLGKIQKVIGAQYPGPRKYEGLPEEPVPAGDNWDMWLGPTPLRPFNAQLQFAWMQWWDYSGGEMTNWGAHGVDQVQWALGMSESGPVEIWPVTPGPNGQVAMRYANDVTVYYESTDQSVAPLGGARFIGEKAVITIDRNNFWTDPPDFVKDPPEPTVRQKWEGPGWISRPHLQNWLDCIKTRGKPNADVEIGHRSISACHLANIARAIGRKIRWDPEKEIFPDDAEANRYISRPRRAGYELPKTS